MPVRFRVALVLLGISVLLYSTFLHVKENTALPVATPIFNAPIYLAKDLNTGATYLSKRDTDRVPIASITKLMTAVIVLEKMRLDDSATVSQEDILYTSRSRFHPGEVMSVRNLMFPLLMESSNEAAEILAHRYGRSDFIREMNKKAIALDMTDSKFADPSGISPENISTAEDLYKLVKYIHENKPYIFDLTAGRAGKSIYPDIHNFNNFVDSKYFYGGKNGQTRAANQTLVTLLNLPTNGTYHTVVFIVLDSLDRIKDESQIINFTINKYFPNLIMAK